MKVTLPAAMYYTGVHSQAEYNIALEGRSEAGVGRGGTRRGGKISAVGKGQEVGTEGTKKAILKFKRDNSTLLICFFCFV